jgi:hypothetical protein
MQKNAKKKTWEEKVPSLILYARQRHRQAQAKQKVEI